MVDTTTIILTAVCTGIGVSMGNALYDIFIKDHFIKLKKAKKKIKYLHTRKITWLAALLNFFIWGLGYLYIGRKRILGVLLILIQVFIASTLSFQAARVTGSYEIINYSFFTLIVSAFLAYDCYRRAKEMNSENSQKKKQTPPQTTEQQ